MIRIIKLDVYAVQGVVGAGRSGQEQ